MICFSVVSWSLPGGNGAVRRDGAVVCEPGLAVVQVKAPEFDALSLALSLVVIAKAELGLFRDVPVEDGAGCGAKTRRESANHPGAGEFCGDGRQGSGEFPEQFKAPPEARGSTEGDEAASQEKIQKIQQEMLLVATGLAEDWPQVRMVVVEVKEPGEESDAEQVLRGESVGLQDIVGGARMVAQAEAGRVLAQRRAWQHLEDFKLDLRWIGADDPVDVADDVVPRLPWTAGEQVDMGFEIIAGAEESQACEVVFWILLAADAGAGVVVERLDTGFQVELPWSSRLEFSTDDRRQQARMDFKMEMDVWEIVFEQAQEVDSALGVDVKSAVKEADVADASGMQIPQFRSDGAQRLEPKRGVAAGAVGALEGTAA